MIRFIYWLAIIIELILFLVVLAIFILTDARTIKFFAKESLASSHFTYEKIEGNFFSGLEIKGLSYNNKELFSSATLHWNPVTIFNRKITLQELDIKGIEIDNILDMVNDFSTTDSSSSIDFNLSILIQNIHLDINQYRFEGVGFSSMLFESDEVSISKDFLLNSSNLNMKFNSDLVNFRLKGKIAESTLFVDTLSLKEIDSKVIKKLVDRLNLKSSSSQGSLTLLKKIKIKEIIATMRDVSYSPISLSKTEVTILDVEIDPYSSYNYGAKSIRFKSITNFGAIDFNGYIKDSTIYTKGSIELSKELFKRYSLPLNYLGLKSLKGELKLNHYGVWLDINHSLKKLLKINSSFNLNILNATHRLHYAYSDNNLTIDSKIEGAMPYSDTFNIKNRVIVDKKSGFRYLGEIDIPKLKSIPKELSDYLLEHIKGKFKGDSISFNTTLDSKLLEGNIKIKDYKSAILLLDSKGDNIELERLFSKLPSEFKRERLSFKSRTFLDFKDFKKSKTTISIISKTLNLNLDMNLLKPFNINFKSQIPYNSIIPNLYKDIKLSSISELEGRVSIYNSSYILTLKGRYLSLLFEYSPITNSIKKATLHLDKNRFQILNTKEMVANQLDIEELLKSVKKYYKIDTPTVHGIVDLDIKKEKKDTIYIRLKSEKIIFDTINIYNIDIKARVDKIGNIVLESYRFRVDDNGYMSRFFSDRKSKLTIKEKMLYIKEFWVNNHLLFSGEYNISSSKGDLSLKAKEYNYKNRDFDFLVDINLSAILDKKRVNISGDIDILGNLISYEFSTFNIVEDSDIVILQDKKSKSSSMLDNLNLNIKINSKNGIKYIGKDIDINLFNDLQIIKRYSSNILLMGMTTIATGYYKMDNRYFTLDNSHIYFAGDPKKPQLDIKANYQKDDYMIHIFISGSKDEPIINFTSEPYLTEQEILSLILFDGIGSSNGGGVDNYTILGGTFAKALIKSLGIDIDHILLGTDERDNISFEIGQKLSKDITVIYQHKNGKDSVKARVAHSRNFETDIVIQPPNGSSIEFLYKYSR